MSNLSSKPLRLNKGGGKRKEKNEQYGAGQKKKSTKYWIHKYLSIIT